MCISSLLNATRAFASSVLVLGLTLSAPLSTHASARDEGAATGDLIGAKMPEWHFSDWINSRPLTLAQLRGKVVLIRWWTAPGCEYCQRSADALRRWDKELRNAGLVVIGAYHHKSRVPLTGEHVETQARKFGFTFPVAIDRDWQTLQEWWLTYKSRGWTSVTFLIGRDGTVRSIHPGGAIVKGESDYAALDTAIRRALDER